MSSLNLWHITSSLKTLIKEAVEASTDWATGTTVTVSAQPPDQLKNETNTLGFYLYHVAENSHYKNLPSPSGNEPPVRYTPMGLDLFYQLTAHGGENEAGIQQAQHLMGLAIKALRDYPVIDESTKVINDKKILDSNLDDSGIRLKIALQPLPHNEAVSYWTAGSSPLQVAAYYQVYVVLLEPEEPQKRAGRVLSYGTYAQVSGTPHLDGTRNVIEYSDPKGNKNQIESKPAQASPAPTPPAAPASAVTIPLESQLTLSGSNLIGDKTTLMLKNSLWDETVEVKDAAWSVKVAANQVTAVIREEVGGKKVLPGIYAAMVKITRERELPEGGKREFDYTSNETPFVVSPRIDTVTGPDAQNRVKVQGFIFKYEVPDPEAEEEGTTKNLVSLQLYIGNVRLQTGVVTNLKEGEFGVHEPPAPELHLRLPKPKDLPPPVEVGNEKYLPLRIFVNGAESPPRWIKLQ